MEFQSALQSPASNVSLYHLPVLEILIPGELFDSLPSGFRLLALQKRLRTDVVVLVSRVRDFHLPILHESYPQGSISRKRFKESGARDNMKSLRLSTAAGIWVIQHCQRLLNELGLTNIERACCIGLLFVLFGGPPDKKLPTISSEQLEQYILELMPVCLDEHDTNAANIFSWACLTVVAANTAMDQCVTASKLACDQGSCFLLEKLVTYFRHANTLAKTRAIMRRFILTEASDQLLVSAWQLKIGDQPVHQDNIDLLKE